tara:strand:- start:3051 stop:3479 length:429 start_codon:yes stop_codon:yes gene_type:complete
MPPSPHSHSDPKHDPKRTRAHPPKSTQSPGFRANVYFDFTNRKASSRQPFTEYYSLNWDETNQKWSLWAEVELWEPVTKNANRKGGRTEVPDVFQLLSAVWKERAEAAHLRLDRFETSEDFPIDPSLEAKLDSLEDEMPNPR